MAPGTNLYPDSTQVKDFAYAESHPLHSAWQEPRSVFDEEEDDDMLDYDYGFYPRANTNDNEDDDNDYKNNDDNMEINQRAVVLFDFAPENENEVALTEGQIILISYRHGQGWLVAEDPDTGENGLVPEEYVQILEDSTKEIPRPFLPEILQEPIGEMAESESEWLDTDDEDPEKGVDELVGHVQSVSIGR
ncbi:HOG (high osmolarity glycerol) pathway protein [Yamadazyma tenuis]|uniref:SH3 domain-containing protein n=1 Tax=Candida tenuis (strain ATCC 10573 / BCRC 21748 / CBS 615 / JCM 9827 / NBRC 10315 / NRRL Y-1498 / VKM Y-70) TaxID=590646 RepID=G3BCM0_CANTC|nr:uncharacterized protein CANTEDRAFT_116255 [Yamadazyma tenuis ATCC 10573]EGV60200.1 hypothetical protein CANTEDRAFT_116255 [Yamadazyma tenuis ATCC 10573]WEJ94563.1 HOG (high osmolarity glycerol) pathway protein [Yamadazyma tenuis]